jgi:hypothetical protein
MWVLLGFVAVAFVILYKRSTEIITVNPLRGLRPGDARPEDEASPSDGADSFDYARLLSTVQQAAEQAVARQAGGPAAGQGRAAIIKLVRNNQFIEAIQLYRRVYGVDLQTAKRAVDQLMLEQ